MHRGYGEYHPNTSKHRASRISSTYMPPLRWARGHGAKASTALPINTPANAPYFQTRLHYHIYPTVPTKAIWLGHAIEVAHIYPKTAWMPLLRYTRQHVRTRLWEERKKGVVPLRQALAAHFILAEDFQQLDWKTMISGKNSNTSIVFMPRAAAGMPYSSRMTHGANTSTSPAGSK